MRLFLTPTKTKRKARLILTGPLLFRNGFLYAIPLLFSMKEGKEALLLIRFRVGFQDAVAELFQRLFYEFWINRFFRNDNAVSTMVIGLHIHVSRLANRVLNMGLAHPAHHPINLQCCLCHNTISLVMPNHSTLSFFSLPLLWPCYNSPAYEMDPERHQKGNGTPFP